MERFHIKLNGWDGSRAFNKYGVEYKPIKVNGPNAGVSQGGGVIVDLLRTKDQLILQGNSVDAATFRKISALARLDYVTAVYEHPETGKTVTKVMIPTLSSANRLPLSKLWYSGWTLTLEER